MTPRVLAALLQPLLALLLFAGVPAAVGAPRDGDARIHAIEASLRALDPAREQASLADLRTANPAEDRLEGEGPEPLALLPAAFAGRPDRARLIRIGRAAYPTAPPSHRPCAAPPTGPPLA